MKEEFIKEFNQKGFFVVPDVLTDVEIKELKTDLISAIEMERKFHGRDNYKDYGMVLVCPMYGKSFIDLVGKKHVMEPFHKIMGEGCIIYAYTSSSMPPHQNNYSSRIHVDCPRFIPGYVTNMGGIILLDDFTEKNGATYFLPGSHLSPNEPTEEEFYRKAERLVAPAGSVCYFSARLWHAGGKNETALWRHAVTINMCRPYMKQRLDLPRLLGEKVLGDMNELSAQKLGYLSQVPASLDEYYQPPEKRKHRQKTE